MLLKLTAEGDVVFVCAQDKMVADRVLKEIQKRYLETLGISPQQPYAFSWIYAFPLLEYAPEEKRYQATHNPFTAPLKEDLDLLNTAPLQARSQQYDLVLNGNEIASGSIRNHHRGIQEQLFQLMGYTKEESEQRFGWMLEALEYGAPPHGGIALGLDRILAIFLGEESIRDVITFPKTQKGACPLSGAPSPVNAKQLKELALKLI